jgi:hypothetical protein
MKSLVYFLTLTLILLAGILAAITISSPTGYVTARGGHVTQLYIAPTAPYGGLYGSTSTTGITQQTIIQDDISKATIYRAQNNCSTATLIAHQTPVLTSIQSITPLEADNLESNSPNNPFSYSQMYASQKDYTTRSNTHLYYTTTTKGNLEDYQQAIAQETNRLAFITEIRRFGYSYNNELATYQLLLPEGQWYFTIDETAPCKDLTTDMVEDESDTPEKILRPVFPDRFCQGVETTFYSTTSTQRVQCRIADMPLGCKPEPEVTVRILRAGQEIYAATTNQNASTATTLVENGDYVVELNKDDKTTRTAFEVSQCISTQTAQSADQETRRTNAQNITAQQLIAPDHQTPQNIDTVYALYQLILLLGTTTMLCAGIVFARLHANDNVTMLELQIIWEKIKRKLL